LTEPEISPDVDVAASANVALRTVESIERDLFERAVPIGSVLGAEKDLMHRYGVGRPALREAIRILQLRGFIRTRSGPHGGLVAALPSLEQVTLPLNARLMLIGITEECVQQARIALGLAAIRLVLRRGEIAMELLREHSERLVETGIQDVENIGLRSRFAVLLSVACGNAALILFARSAASLVDRQYFRHPAFATDAEQLRWMRSVERAIITAIMLGDGDAACRLLTTYHRRTDSVLNLTGDSPVPIPPATLDPLTHRATRLARQIVLTLMKNRPADGERIGSEEEFCTAYESSNSTVQQALRILEADGLVRRRPGRGLGVYAKRPNLQTNITGLCRYLQGRGFDQSGANELIHALCLELRLQDQYADVDAIEQLSHWLGASHDDSAAYAEMAAWLQANTAHNMIIELLAQVVSAWRS
jgi:DNA-binding FadR family transcriptional regulator